MKKDDNFYYSTKELTKQDFEGDVVDLKMVNPIAIKDIESKIAPGNLLFLENKNFNFAPNFSHCLIINSRSADSYKLPKYGIGKYILDQLHVFAKSKNRPSLIIKSINFADNGDLFEGVLSESYKKLEKVEIEKFNIIPSYYYCETNENFRELVEKLYKSRSNSTTGMLPVFIIIDDIVNVDLSRLNTWVTTARSRNIHFIVIMDSTADYKSVGENFDLRIACENSELKRITEVVCGVPMLVKEFNDENTENIQNTESYVSIDKYLKQHPEIKLTKKEMSTLQNNCWLKKASKESTKESKKILGKNTPEPLKKWLNLYNGEKIFSQKIFNDKDIKEYNSKEYKQSIKMDKNAMVFAGAGDGDFICFDNEEMTGAIYEWGIHEQKAIAKWKSFNTWLRDVIKTGTKELEKLNEYLKEIENK